MSEIKDSRLVQLIETDEWVKVNERLRSKQGKQEARTADANKWFPIHRAMERNDIPLLVVKDLLDAYPEGIRKKAWDDSLPIHVAVQFCSTDVVKFLISKYPKGVQEVTDCGNLPLHNALIEGETENINEVIELLILKYPKGLEMKTTRDGSTALHDAFDNKYVSSEVIRMLVDTYPAALLIVDSDGNLPIHNACVDGASLEVLKILIDYYPESVLRKNKVGDRPVDCFGGGCAESDVVQFLNNAEKKCIEDSNYHNNVADKSEKEEALHHNYVETLEAFKRMQMEVSYARSCTICRHKQRNIVCQPCGHVYFCADCGASHSICVICNSVINYKCYVHLPY